MKRPIMLVAAIIASTSMGTARGQEGAAQLDLSPLGIVRKDDTLIAQQDGMELLFVARGEFVMGSDTGHYSERPAHRVQLAPFLIDKHEVTNAQFEKFIKDSRYKPGGPWRRGYPSANTPDHPVRFVTWYDAQAYARWAGRTLPTEAQWEMAARGTEGLTYPWGMKWKDGVAHTNLAISAGPTRVGSFRQRASPYGCLDMGGNVWEWVNDWYDRFYYEEFKNGQAVYNPTGPQDGASPEQRFIDTKTAAGNERSTRKVIRGGGWGHGGPENLRCSKRTAANPRYWFPDTGFRCAISLSTPIGH